MAKFNKSSKGINKTTNLAGGEAFKESPELELVTLLLTSFVEDKFYETSDAQLARLEQILQNVDPLLAAKAAIYARNEFGMRSITHALIGELVASVKGEEWTKFAVASAMRRPDDMTETVAYFLNKYDKPIPNALKKGLALAFNKFDAYQLAKYRGGRHRVSLVDVANLVHPTPTEENKDALESLVEDTLRSRRTWESKLTSAGQGAEDEDDLEERKEKAWAEMIESGDIGYFALLRNLRNIMQDAPEVLDDALKILMDEERIEKSLVLPFRYLSASDAISETNDDRAGDVLAAINTALDISVRNVPEFPGKTLVVVDDSGSMGGRPITIAALFAAILYKSNDADFMRFSDDASYRSFDSNDTTRTIADLIIDHAVFSGTNFHSIFQEANKPYERVVILSDMQGWMGHYAPTESFEKYKKRCGADPYIYSFDLNGYGSTQFPEHKIHCLSGWSDKVFDVMELLEKDRTALLHDIEKIEI